ncbi:MAG: hypothetical protein HQK50_17390 [Oligoflexia bacterium]|nr:hypothetical protein [Oligoflexia bacterium]MBF0367353.1 hypothetical protein [Oligoflexia bacterium]
MQIKVAFLKSDRSLSIRDLSHDGITSVTTDISLSDLEQEPIDLLLYSQKELNEELSHLLDQQEKHYPIICADSGNVMMPYQDFMQTSFGDLQPLFQESHSKWTLKNNILLLEELFPLTKYFKQQMDQDRVAAFEELWCLLKSNLGTSSLKLIYKDLVRPPTSSGSTATEDTENSSTDRPNTETTSTTAASQPQRNRRGRLVNMTTEGTTTPTTSPGGELEAKLLEIYAPRCTSPFQISEAVSEKGEYLLLASIKESPIIIMATAYAMNPLVPSLLKSLFTGLNQ